MKVSSAVLCALLAPPALAATPAPNVPKPLEPWVPWVLHGEEATRCPFLQGEGSESGPQTNCLWPSRLNLSVDDKSGAFTQQWTVYDSRGAWVPLPGDAKAWPQDVRIDGAAAVVTDVGASPRVHLAAGTHTVGGAFLWDAQPESLQIPGDTGLLALRLRGKPVDFPTWSEGKLWLQRQIAETPEENRLVVTVERRLDDDIPAFVTTKLQLSVSGKSREVTVGPALLAGYTALSIDSPLPVRLEPDGRLRIQVRPGDWTLDLTARSSGPVTGVTEPKIDEPWGDEVVWVFSARNDLRQVSLEGAPAIDPQQTRLPDAWKGLPAYRLKPGESLKLVESRRGDPEPAPDRLTLGRTLWLDFNGGGYTVHDIVRGTLHRGWRLDVAPQLKLGRVAVGGQNQFITRQGTGPLGVEIRQGQLDLEADARLEGDVDHLPAVGWQHDFKQVAISLNLPPGWRLFHATGVDSVSPTWVKSWTLLDLFVVLITALAAWRIFGLGWGLVALFTLGLSYHEAGSPQWLWLVILGLVALVRALPQGKFRKLSHFAQLGLSVLLVLIVAAFVVQQVRQAMYPDLENETGGGTPDIGFGHLMAAPVNALAGNMEPTAPPLTAAMQMAPVPEPVPMANDQLLDGEGVGGAGKHASPKQAMKKEMAPAKGGRAGWASQSQAIVSNYSQQSDPNAAIQTGAGLTSWSWRTAYLSFSGPVEAIQEIQLYLIPPGLERFLELLRVILCALFTLCLLGFPGDFWPKAWKPKHAAVALFFLGTLLAAHPARADDYPNDSMLAELKKRLLEKPTCAPNCASLQRLDLTIGEAALKAELQVGAAADTAIELPGDAKQWRPVQVEIDGHPAQALWRDNDGSLWVEVPAGAHKIGLEGPLPKRDQIQIAMPMKPHYTAVHATGWTVQGLQDDGQVDDNLQLSRIAKKAATPEAEGTQSLQPGDLPGFARVQRTLQIGLTWNVHTEVTRVSPASSALVLAVPLLHGEQVTSADVHVVDGKVALNLNPGQTTTSWDSVLPQTSPLRLEAPKDVGWTEQWRLDVSPIWHAEAQGIPVIHGQDSGGNRLPEWWPWPGEWVNLEITRPAGVPGPTLTLDDSSLRLTPGLRSTDAQLVLRLRSSRGGEHELTLPAGAKLQKLVVNEQSQPVRQSGDKVTLSLKPGSEAVELDWTEAHGMDVVYQAPAVDLGTPSVNVHTDIQVPSERFVLLVSPSRLGPAVLFWGVLVAMLLLSFGLGALGLTPLGAAAWFTLSLGFTQAPVEAGVIFVGWLLALGWRRKHPFSHRALFNLGQIVLVLGSLWAAASLIDAVKSGLLGQPDMQVTGNGSSESLLRGYVDRSDARLPEPWVLSVPLWVYRAAMLAWALWLATACLRWVKWGWESFGTGGMWKGKPPAPPAAAPVRPPAPPAPVTPPR